MSGISDTTLPVRRLPVGAEPTLDGTHFRVWAPDRAVELEIVRVESGKTRRGGLEDGCFIPLKAEANGYWSTTVAEAGPGTLYRFRLDDGRSYPDPASRYQPEGPHGPSCVVDPAFAWTDRAWQGVPAMPGPVVYECHIGTFTQEGSWAAALQRLPRLRDLGVSVLQMMPVADFPGAFGWGYDGVLQFAPYHRYGAPADLRRFVDGAHRVGMAVILDVVYNHLGPDGNYLWAYSPDYFSRVHATDWGDTPNFDGPASEHVRAYFLANVRHWVEEYHFDGFRFDATQNIYDDGPDHILAAMAREARDAAGSRRVLLVAENEPQDTNFLRPPAQGGIGFDMLGNEDFHHSAVVALTGRRRAYNKNHRGSPQEFVSALKHGLLYQGQWYDWQDQRRGSSTRGLPPRAFLHFLENHDQVANSMRGTRIHRLSSPGRWRAMVGLQLLGPQTPFLFQGQEFASSAPFRYFADQPPELAEQTREGRNEALAEFENLTTPEVIERLPDPADIQTFEVSKLDWREWDAHPEAVALHRDLLALRADDEIFSGRVGSTLDGAVLDTDAFVMRWFGSDGSGETDRLLLVNLGKDLEVRPAPEPLLAPPPARFWTLRWSSEHPRYGGSGTPPVETEGWNLPAASALVMSPTRPDEPDPAAAAMRSRGGRTDDGASK
jgi:maltooligosyltrehalose trehalohydrolase